MSVQMVFLFMALSAVVGLILGAALATSRMNQRAVAAEEIVVDGGDEEIGRAMALARLAESGVGYDGASADGFREVIERAMGRAADSGDHRFLTAVIVTAIMWRGWLLRVGGSVPPTATVSR